MKNGSRKSGILSCQLPDTEHIHQYHCGQKCPQTDLSLPLRCSRVMVKMACEREEAAFIAVEPTVRAEFPSSRQLTISYAENTCFSVNPTICKKRKKKKMIQVIKVEMGHGTMCVNRKITHLNTLFRVFTNADGRFIFRHTQQIQYFFIIDLQQEGY